MPEIPSEMQGFEDSIFQFVSYVRVSVISLFTYSIIHRTHIFPVSLA